MLGCVSACGSSDSASDQGAEITTESVQEITEGDNKAANEELETAQAENEEETPAGTETDTSEDKDGLKIVTTIFPEYDWVKTILGDKAEDAELTLLLDNGVDLHSYQPTAEDIIKIQESDMFVYVGGESDEWVEDVLESVENPDIKVINLLDSLGDSAKAEETVEGMEEGHDHDHEHEHEHSKEVSTFEDSEVQDRALSDWEGDWQSAYPLVLDGSLDEAWEHKAEDGDMTAEEYKEYYTAGYKSEYTNISIHGDTITFTDDKGNVTESAYKYTGYFIQDWSTGTRAAMYRFEAEDKESGAPIYIEFNDHIIEPEKAEHFHIRMSNESYDAIVDPEGNWPTFFDASLSPEGVCEEVIGHGAHEEEMDEHVWLSLKNASLLCESIESELEEIDPENADTYKSNLDAYKEELAQLDKEYETAVSEGNQKTLLFGDRFPFRYLVDDYGLEYFAAFSGCSAESEASFETIVFLAGKVDELGLGAIMTIEGPNHEIAEAVKNATTSKDQEILTMDSLQSTTSKDIE
ncbi:MAG: ZinT/AdcA family metal-binding protein, partial [Eubacterium sp.]|nr:ZinT/AdcA family metal-binding protein [Eubacterium sp.]